MPSQKTFTKIADHFRDRILSGELAPGSRLPTNREISGQWQVAAATVSRALQALQVENYIRTTPRGTFVTDDGHWTLSGRDRLTQVQRVKSTLADGETSRVTVAELIVPPLYVAELFDLDPGDQIVRREWLAGRGQARTMFATTWYPAQFAALVPDLLSTAPGKNHGLSARVLEATGRTITHARDDMHAREASAREASALGVRVGSTILAGVHRWSDTDGIIEYGEWCLPPRITIGYEYQP
ncbi:GntR family transcriptional regulator [Streptomyces sp. NPDC057638]|uniref:GntR family transcriptional regulator n=1 Tax=Streptomyces sp. NPDC057638 TaxID=3346190 RepID=UPI00367CECFB